MTNLLSIDTSTDYLSLAVSCGDDVVAKLHRKVPMMHSTLLVPTIAAILKKAGIALAGLDGFCISIGPGSFTGLRIGVTTVKGLSYATGKPVVAVPTLDIIAHNAIKHAGIICSILDARKGKVYACIYSSDGISLKRLSKYLLVPTADLMTMIKGYDDVLFLGDMAEKIRGINIFTRWHPRAEVAARYGATKFRAKRFVSAMTLEPLYLYSRECDIKGK